MYKQTFLDRFDSMMPTHGTNVMTDGLNVWLYGCRIYKKQDKAIYITDAGYPTALTCRWLNALLAQAGIYSAISRKKGDMCFRGKPLQSRAWYKITQGTYVTSIEVCMPPIYESEGEDGL